MMWLFLGLFLTIALADSQTSGCSTSVSPGTFTFQVGSTSTTGYLIQAGGANSWGPVTPAGSSVTIGLGPRFYLANSCTSSFSPTVFSAVKLLGGSICFDVDISKIGCGRNAAFYLVGMPGPGAASNGDYYCDANAVGGQSCSEMDLFEANRHAIQITPHRCVGSCDTSGCAKNTQSISKGFGPDSSFTINSANPFTVKISFPTGSGKLSGITSVISQITSGTTKSITLTHGSECGSTYISDMTPAFTSGMVPVWSYWSGNVAWLDSPACSSETTEVTGNFIFSNLIVTGSTVSTTGPPLPPPPPPGSLNCGTSGTTTNLNWVEFKAPSGVAGASTAASVTCNNKQSYTCSWSPSPNNKYQCSCPNAGCTAPFTVTVGGKNCVLSSSAAISDSTAETTFGSNQPLIIGLSVGIAVTILVILVLIVVFFIRKQTGTYLETV